MSEISPVLAGWGFGLGLLVFALFGLHLRLGWRGTRRGFWLLVAIAVSMLWAAAGFAFSRSGAWLFWPLGGALDGLRYAAWTIFCLSLLAPEGERPSRSISRIRNGVLTVVAVRVLVELAVGVGLGDGVFAGSVSIAIALACSVAGLVAVEQLFRNFPTESRWGIKPLCIGLAACFFFDIYVFADALLYRRIDLALWGMRAVPAALAMPLIAISAARSRDWDFRITVSREVIFHSTTLALVGGFLLVVAGAGYWVRYAGGAWGRPLQVLLLFGGLSAVGLALFSGSLRARLRVWLSKHFFSYRYDYREEWLRVTQALGTTGASSDLASAVIRALADLVESPGGQLWLRDRSGRFVPSGRLNIPDVDAVEPDHGVLAAFIRRRGWIVDLEQARSQPYLYEGFSPPEWLSLIPDAWLVVPLFAGDELEGFVVLITARTRVDIDWEVLDLLKTAGRQAAVQLARVQATEALLEAQKFDSFNRMSAFVVHDLKNLVAQLQLMLRNADRHGANPEFQQDMLETVRHVLQRMQGLMGQLQEKKSIDPRRPVDLLEIVSRIAQSKRHQSPAVEVSGEPGLQTMAHAERIERVVGHLVQNALDATQGNGIVAVSVHPEGALCRLEVRDTGTGMSSQFVRERLFKPFQTTKDAGMGVGAYEALQYITELGGRIDVESEPGLGTCMSVRLPRIEASAANAA